MKIKKLTPDQSQKVLQLVVKDATIAEMVDLYHSVKEIYDDFSCQKTEEEKEISSIIKFDIPEEYERVYEALKNKFGITD